METAPMSNYTAHNLLLQFATTDAVSGGYMTNKQTYDGTTGLGYSV